MTWYADEILLRATPAALAAINADEQLLPFAYHLQSLSDFQWYRPEHRHGLPEEGLLIIRPISNPQSHGGRWYAEPVLDSQTLSPAPQAQSLLLPELPESLCQSLNASDLPATALRSHLAALASQLHEPVVFYSCSMWGGDIDHEFCLIYEPQESITVSDATDSIDNDAWALRKALHTVGLDLPSGFFAPHTRSFDWTVHALRSQPQPGLSSITAT